MKFPAQIFENKFSRSIKNAKKKYFSKFKKQTSYKMKFDSFDFPKF